MLFRCCDLVFCLSCIVSDSAKFYQQIGSGKDTTSDFSSVEVVGLPLCVCTALEEIGNLKGFAAYSSQAYMAMHGAYGPVLAGPAGPAAHMYM